MKITAETNPDLNRNRIYDVRDTVAHELSSQLVPSYVVSSYNILIDGEECIDHSHL